MEVGFIGVGRMGLPIARNLLAAGHSLIVYNRTRSRAELLRDNGALIAGSVAEAAGAEIVMTLLADDRDRFPLSPQARSHSRLHEHH